METPEQRHARGAAMLAAFTSDDLADLAYLRSIEATMRPNVLEQFREIFNSQECRGCAGVRAAADMAVRELWRRAVGDIAGDIVKPTWRAR